MLLRGLNGYTGRRGPVKEKEGKGLKCPSASGSDTTLGVMMEESILFAVLCSCLCVLCIHPCQQRILNVGLFSHELTYPIPLKAILTAEVCLFP